MIVAVAPFVTNAAAQPPGQPAPSRLEIGAQASLLHFSDVDTTTAGIGGRVSFDLTPWLAIEGEGTFFPSDEFILPSAGIEPDLRVSYHRQRTEAFFGVKTGVRSDRIGVFAKVRPGFTYLSGSGVDCVGDVCALALFIRPEDGPEFALDLGGVFEFYPSLRTVARFELGDTMIRHRRVTPLCTASSCTSHNLSTRIGAGFRF
jgi:hypothetical protein